MIKRYYIVKKEKHTYSETIEDLAFTESFAKAKAVADAMNSHTADFYITFDVRDEGGEVLYTGGV